MVRTVTDFSRRIIVFANFQNPIAYIEYRYSISHLRINHATIVISVAIIISISLITFIEYNYE